MGLSVCLNNLPAHVQLETAYFIESFKYTLCVTMLMIGMTAKSDKGDFASQKTGFFYFW